MLQRLRRFLTVFDDRFEDLRPGSLTTTMYRDFSAGLIVAMTAIPMAMGFAIASGLRPEQGIIAGAVACLVGRTFGGSKYQVYGPTAAFIPVIAMIVGKYGHPFLVTVSIAAGLVLMVMGLLGLGRVARLVPESIVVGFTVGIAVTIAASNAGEAFGLNFKAISFIDIHDEGLGPDYSRLSLGDFTGLLAKVNWAAFGLALGTFLACRYLMRISVFIPAPLIAIGTCTILAGTALSGRGITVVADRFGTIPTNFFAITPPGLPELGWSVAFDAAYYVLAIAFVSGVESLLCSSMADKLAENKGTPFDPDKEFWGQGMVQIITPLLNGFPCTGALARTATSIKAGAVTPLAGYFKGVLKLGLAVFVAPYLEHVPMSCIAGILFWVASNMIKPSEIRRQIREGVFPALLVAYTAILVVATDFLTGVLSALILYAAGRLVGRVLPSRNRGTPAEVVVEGGTPVEPLA